MPIQCCHVCGPIVSSGADLQFAKVRQAEKHCRFCAFLINTLDPGGEQHQYVLKGILGGAGNGLKYKGKGNCAIWMYPDGSENTPISVLQRRFSPRPEPGTTGENPTGSDVVSLKTHSLRFTLIREWLHRCDKTHDCNKHSNKIERFLPTRLLYVGGKDDPDTLRLILSTEIEDAKYIALSHRWGTLSDSEKDVICTTTKNIGDRLNGFSTSDLPKTFQDAVTVTRQLSQSYLWIDSLCIIQAGDDGKDWERECRLMESVFSFAHCTVAATSANDMKHGFLDLKDHVDYLRVQGSSGMRYTVSAGTDDFERDVGRAELNARGWVLQERVLSRRIVHFAANRVYWECGPGVYCENLTAMKSPPTGNFFTRDPEFPKRLLGSGTEDTRDFILFLFEIFSKMRLSQSTDRAIALSGLQDRLERTLKCEGRFGVLQAFFGRTLLWHTCDAQTEWIRYHERKVPSWSWQARSGSIQFMRPPDNVKWIDNLQFDSKRKEALIADVVRFQNCTTDTKEQFRAVLNVEGETRGQIHFDIVASEKFEELRAIVVGKFKEDEDGLALKMYCILVVRRTDVEGEYQRIGAGAIGREYVEREASNVRLV